VRHSLFGDYKQVICCALQTRRNVANGSNNFSMADQNIGHVPKRMALVYFDELLSDLKGKDPSCPNMREQRAR
jgi:hypothetical protein